MKKPSKAPEPLRIFIQANNFVLAHHVLASQRADWLNATAYAGMVVAAFAAELYMKTLICLEAKAVPKLHDLKKLFDQISPERRSRIEHHWSEQVLRNERKFRDAERDLRTQLPRDLGIALTRGANAFEALRYAYEEAASENTFVLGDLPACVREVIVEIKPEWRGITDNPNVISG